MIIWDLKVSTESVLKSSRCSDRIAVLLYARAVGNYKQTTARKRAVHISLVEIRIYL